MFFKLYLTKVFGHISSRLQTVLLKTKDELIYSKTLFLWFIHCNDLGIVVHYYQTASFKISKEIRHNIIINILLKNTDSCISLKQFYFWQWRKPIKINCHRNFTNITSVQNTLYRFKRYIFSSNCNERMKIVAWYLRLIRWL